MKTTNIYILIDPETQQIRYVGKANNISQRYKAHLNRARKHQIHKLNWINSLKKKGLKPILEVIDVVPIDKWMFWETYWIAQFKAWGYNLLNYTQGGDGCTFGNQTSFKKGIVPWNTGKGNINICQECSTEFKAPKSAKRKFCSMGCISTYSSKNKNSGTFKVGNPSWIKGKIGIKLKPDKNVYQFNKDKTIMIHKWNSAKEASEALNISAEGIGQCARGTSKSCGDFYWNYNNILQ